MELERPSLKNTSIKDTGPEELNTNTDLSTESLKMRSGLRNADIIMLGKSVANYKYLLSIVSQKNIHPAKNNLS